MANEKIYPEGVRCFNRNDKQPDFVLGSMVITPNDLVTWLKANEGYLTEYNGKKQLRLQILSGKDGPYLTVDTFKPKAKSVVEDQDSQLPF